MIKKHANKNEYYYAGTGLWIRNYTKKLVVPQDINSLIPEQDMAVLLENEIENQKLTIQQIDTEDFDLPNIVIVSDGYDFLQKHKVLEELPGNIAIIGVNGAFINWKANRRLNFYVVNNPYQECLEFLPAKASGWPRLVASTRTNPDFMKKYHGIQYQYTPTQDKNFSGIKSEAEYTIDDYRNPICAAIVLAYKFKVKKLLLLCCDEAFVEQRPGTEKLANDLYIYPQQKLAHTLINGNLYWLLDNDIEVTNHSAVEYKNTTYIAAEDIVKFFKG